jgi:hypothetical protein
MDFILNENSLSNALAFKTAPAAIQERRQLLRDLRLGLALALALLCLALENAPLGVQAACWALAALLLWGLWRLDGEGLLAPFASRELRIQESALELVEGRFTRLLFFEQLEQLRMIQGRDEKVLALELQTLEGALLLRGYENMESLFAILNARKPGRVLLEVEEIRFNRESVSAWSRAVFLGGAILLLLLLLAGPSPDALKKVSGLLLIALAVFVAVFQPFSHRRGKRAALAEVGMGIIFTLFGILFLI